MSAEARRRARRRGRTAAPQPREVPPDVPAEVTGEPLARREISPDDVARGALAVAALYFGWNALALLLHDPAVWPDEGLFADPALHLLRDGRLGTEVLRGYLPGIEARTYWIPPLYPVALAAVFAVFGATVTAMRGFSALTGLAALALTQRIARRAGLDALPAALPVALVAVDAVFLRAARLGRMDLLALTLCLAAVFSAVGDPEDETIPLWRRAMFRAGLFAGAAFITHPMGAAGLVAVGVAALRSSSRRAAVAAVALGAALPVALWGVYIAVDPRSFAAQFGAQLARKAGREPFSAASLGNALRVYLEQYADLSRRGDGGDPRAAVQALWALGLVGLLRLAARHRAGAALLALHAAFAALALLSLEMWYPVYVVPTTALGVAALLGPAGFGGWSRAVVLAVAGWFALGNVTREGTLRARWQEAGEAARYDTFCASVSAKIPPGATVFVSLFPDLTLCLARRTDLTVRTFLPEGLPVPAAQQRAVLDAAEYVVTGRDAPGTLADILAPRLGTPVAEVGAPRNNAYHARIYRMPGARH